MPVSEDAKRNFGALIKSRRKSSVPPISQRSLAATIGTTQAAISMYENGAMVPSLEVFLALCRVLNLELEEVLGILTEQSNVEPLVYTLAETAVVLALGERQVTEMIRAGRLPAVQWGRSQVVPRAAVRALLAETMRDFDPTKAVEGL
jgi:excisionase family DNA binding protein